MEDEEEDEENADENEEGSESEGDGDKPFTAFYEEDTLLKDKIIFSEDVFALGDDIEGAGLGDDDSSEEEEDLGLPRPDTLPPYWSIHVLVNQDNVWANLQSLNPCNC